MTRLYDLTPPLRMGMIAWPGDPAYAAEPALTVERDGVAVRRIALGTHTGAHVDAPAHLLPGGPTVGELPLGALIGPAVVVEWTGEGHVRVEGAPSPPAPLPAGEGAPSPPAPLPAGEGAPSPPAHLPKGEGAPSPLAPLPAGEGAPSPPAPLPKGEGRGGGLRVLFKTRNSARGLMRAASFDPAYIALTAESARWLADHGALLVGIDAPSVDPYDADDLPAHRALLGAGVVIVEGLDLAGVPPGAYMLYALPLPLAGADGAPARVILIGD